MTSPLPERPNLEQLKNQAKTLLRAAQSADPAALARFQAQPAFAGKSAADLARVALNDAQSVIAREHGFPSWNALREHVEERTLTFAAAADEFLRCATGGAAGRAQRLLALHPGIAHASLQAELVLGDAAAVAARLDHHPGRATQAGGPLGWEPLLYVCHTCVCRDAPDRLTGLVAIAHRLLSLGANPNAEYHWQWHPELPRTALWGALCEVGSLPLAEMLLDGGANPTDGVSLHINAGGGNLAAAELLLRYGVTVDGVPGGVPPLAYILTWSNAPAGPRWLLAHGADANLAWAESGEAPIHVAARRWDVAMIEHLVAHGADLHRRRPDGATAHTLAALHGNHAVAEWLLAHGAKDELSPLERFVAACARGDRAAAEAALRERPELRHELRREHHLMLQRAAESGDTAALATMLAGGFDPAVADKDGFMPLHRAAMAGHPASVRLLLAHGAPVNALDATFAATPLVAAAEGRTWGRHPGSDYPEVARLLIAAGSALEWIPPRDAPNPEGTLDKLADLLRDAGNLARKS
ncbi:MAG TPA: ankyrin repeat domain-containing protein [Opitutus sp.]|nr:ankyrin repeat domain-containing protein [Opitutus sp.]